MSGAFEALHLVAQPSTISKTELGAGSKLGAVHTHQKPTGKTGLSLRFASDVELSLLSWLDCSAVACEPKPGSTNAEAKRGPSFFLSCSGSERVPFRSPVIMYCVRSFQAP